ncbi:hypothetical protein [Rhodophyticola sp. CCM32]|uniref:hypothetical protein n=1 Tax=Rhodophyticola sp. CCM32 TaxID=2916397 RepID=UPI00143D7808|nr:hypothetical protein [Rhodophyticola sp. CCM32]
MLGRVRALKDHDRAVNTVFVAHEATNDNKTLLLNGTLDAVIDQNPQVEIREMFNTLTHAVRGQGYHMALPRLKVIFRENLPGD